MRTILLTTEKFLVRKGGLEPPPLAGPDPKSGAAANYATFAQRENSIQTSDVHKGEACRNYSAALARLIKR